MAQVLPSVQAKLAGKKTTSGFTLDDVIRSGVVHPDSGVGCYAPDAESYKMFAPFFNQIVKLYHGYDPTTQKHTKDLDASKLFGLKPLNDERVISTRIRCGRNLAGVPFAPGISREQRDQVEVKVRTALSFFKNDLAGRYFPLTGMPADVQKQMIEDHFLFKEGDKYLEAAGCNRDWPHGRGIYYNGAKTALVWVNEEDELRIISMQKGSGFLETFSRFALMVNTLEQHLEFAFDPSLGYLSSCPTNLGTAMRASVHVKLPKLLASGRLNDLGKKYGLSIRGIHGEHSKSVGGIVDISNTQRLGITEVEGVTKMYQGLVHLLKEEDKA
jgi:creatine kinase/arginine kinase